MKQTPVWTTARLRLRPLCPADLEAVYRYAADAEHTRYMIFYPHRSREETRAFLAYAQQEWDRQRPTCYEFAVELAGEVIGGVTLYLDEDRTTGELGWLVRREMQGRGYVSEAVRCLIDRARELEPGLRQLRAECDSRNLPSRRLAERLGMTLSNANSRRTYPQTGEEADQVVYTLDL